MVYTSRTMAAMLALFSATVLPIAVAVCAGVILKHWRRTPTLPLATLAVDVLGPALVLGHIPVGLANQGRLILVVLGTVVVSFALTAAAATLLGLKRSDDWRGFVAAVTFANFGFVGLPLVEFAYGAVALPTAMAVLTVLNIPTGVFAIILASPHSDVREALRHTAKQPFAWACAAAFALGLAGLDLPPWLTRPLKLLGSGVIPVMLVVLGMQLAELSLGRFRWGAAATAAGMRLLLGPVLAAALAAVFGVDGIERHCAVLQLATPPGMTPLLFFAAFGRDTSLLATAVLLGTTAALVTVPLLLTVMG